MIIPRKLKGFGDQLPQEWAQRYAMMDRIYEEAFKAGFEGIETPALEYADVLLGVGGETDKQVFRFQDQGHRDVMMRFDLTVPLARFVSEHYNHLVFPWRRIQIAPVWRAEKPQRGRYREFFQCDLDIVGAEDGRSDKEILSLMGTILSKITGERWHMKLGHRSLLTALIAPFFPAGENETLNKILILLDKKEKITEESLLQQLVELMGDSAKNLMERLAVLSQSPEKILDFLPDDQKETYKDLESLCLFLRRLFPEEKISIDLFIVRGLGYYSGLVFETFLQKDPSLGSVASGGRYDHLLERFRKESLPAVGMSLGLDRLLSSSLNFAMETKTSLKILIIPLGNPVALDSCFQWILALRSLGFSVEMNLKNGKASQILRQASQKSFSHVLFWGDEERSRDEVLIKNMKNQEQVRVSTKQICDYFSTLSPLT